MANCNRQQLNITCGTDVVLHDRLIFDGETFDPNLSVGIAANLVSSLGKRTALDVQVVDDELLISVPWIDGTLPGCYGLEVTGSCNSKKWATYADSLIKYTKATRIGVSEVTVESDSYDITQEIGYCYSNSPVTIANVTVDDGYGTPGVDVTYEQRVLSMAFHNLKGDPGEMGLQGIQGIPGESAIFDPQTGNISTMKQSTGDDVLSPMSQKAISDEVTKSAEITGISFNDGKGVQQSDGTLKTNSALSYTDFIDISAYTELYVPALGLSSSYGWAFYDTNKAFIRGGSHQGPEFPATFIYYHVYTQGAAYIRFTGFATTSEYYTTNPPLYYIEHIKTIVSSMANDLSRLEATQIDDEIYKFTPVDTSLYSGYHKFVNYSGVWANGGGNSACKLMPVTPGEKYKVENGENVSSHHVFFVIDNDMTNGNPPNLAGGITTVPKATSAPEYLVAPYNAAYMYIRSKSGGVNVAPKVFTYETIKEKVTASDNRLPKAINAGTWENGYIQSSGEERSSSSYCRTSFIKADNLVSVVSSVPVSVNCYDADYNHIIMAQNYGTSFTQWPVECAFVRLWIAHANPSTADSVLTITKNVGGTGRLASLDGKSVVTFGDSITWYDGNLYLNGKAEGDFVYGYQHYMRMVGMSTCNKGESGYESKRIVNVVNAFTRFAQMDYMTLMTGANDERLGVNVGVVLPIGSTYNTNTYAGALQTIIERALSENPRLKIILFTPIKGWFYGNDPRMIRDDYVYAVKAIGNLYSIPVLDLHNLIGLNDFTRNIMINDPEPPENELYSLHPSNYGYERMASVILPFLADV